MYAARTLNAAAAAANASRAGGVPHGESSAAWSVQILSKFSTLSTWFTLGLKGDAICAAKRFQTGPAMHCNFLVRIPHHKQRRMDDACSSTGMPLHAA